MYEQEKVTLTLAQAYDYEFILIETSKAHAFGEPEKFHGHADSINRSLDWIDGVLKSQPNEVWVNKRDMKGAFLACVHYQIKRPLWLTELNEDNWLFEDDCPYERKAKPKEPKQTITDQTTKAELDQHSIEIQAKHESEGTLSLRNQLGKARDKCIGDSLAEISKMPTKTDEQIQAKIDAYESYSLTQELKEQFEKLPEPTPEPELTEGQLLKFLAFKYDFDLEEQSQIALSIKG